MPRTTCVLLTLVSLLLLFTASCHSSTKAEEPGGGGTTDTGTGSDTVSPTDTGAGSDTVSQSDSDSGQNQIAVDPEDRWCEEGENCVVVWTSCNPYSPAAVNELASDKYYEQYQEMCKDIQWEQPLFSATASCMMDWQSDRRTCILDGIEIQSDAAQMCERSEDCAAASSRCDFCECFGLPINAAYKDEASALFSDVCRDYQGGVCDIYCEETRYLDCVEGYCSWTE